MAVLRIVGFSRMGSRLDEKGRKMSKSIGNTLVPQKLTHPGRRRWFGSGSPPPTTPNEMSVSERDLEAHGGFVPAPCATRCAFLLGQPARFDPAQHAVPWHETRRHRSVGHFPSFALQNDVVTAYRNYEFHDIYQKVHNFCVVSSAAFTWTSSKIVSTPRALRAGRADRRKPRCTTSHPPWCAGSRPY